MGIQEGNNNHKFFWLCLYLWLDEAEIFLQNLVWILFLHESVSNDQQTL